MHIFGALLDRRRCFSWKTSGPTWVNIFPANSESFWNVSITYEKYIRWELRRTDPKHHLTHDLPFWLWPRIVKLVVDYMSIWKTLCVDIISPIAKEPIQHRRCEDYARYIFTMENYSMSNSPSGGGWSSLLSPTSDDQVSDETTLIARFMGPTWGPSGADRTQMGPMLAPWTLLSEY